MELLVLDTTFKSIAIIDTYESFIWNDRYDSYGDFELYTKATIDIVSLLKKNYYLYNKESEHLMIIENVQIKFDIETGDTILFSGRSIESLLDRRIIWDQTVIDGNLQNGIKDLINNNIINPTITDRKIDNFIFEDSIDPEITSLTITTQYIRTNLYETISDICNAYDIGFKITLNDNNQFVFSLYSGKDRSYNQTINNYVIFSKEFDNLLSSNYIESIKSYKTVTLVTGEGDEEDKKKITVGSGLGLDRREIYTDASNISQTVDGDMMTDEEYIAQLTEKGNLELNINSMISNFDAQIVTDGIFKYKQDYFIGDIVQIYSAYGIEGTARITEYIYSVNSNGIESYPRFTIL
jgi:hypothetical protein